MRLGWLFKFPPMDAVIILTFAAVLVVSNVLGIGILSAYIANQTKQYWLTAFVSFLTLGILYCLAFLITPLEGKLKIVFLERLPYEVGMLLGLGILWIQWCIQVLLYWRRRRYSPMMYRIFNSLMAGQAINLIGIGIIFLLCPTMMIIQRGWSNDPATFRSVWLFELGWLTYFTLAFITPILLLSLRGMPKFWQIRHWIAGASSLFVIAWWVYWFNCADVVQSIAP